MYYGVISSEIHFDYDENKWEMQVYGKKEATRATSDNKGRVQKFLLSKLVDWSINFYSNDPLVPYGAKMDWDTSNPPTNHITSFSLGN